MNLASYTFTRVSSFPTAQYKVTSFTVLLTGRTNAVTETAVTTCSSADDCTVSPSRLVQRQLVHCDVLLLKVASRFERRQFGHCQGHDWKVHSRPCWVQISPERVHVERFDCNLLHLHLTGSDKVKTGQECLCSGNIKLERRGSEVHDEQLDALVTKVRLGVIGASLGTSFNQPRGNDSPHLPIWWVHRGRITVVMRRALDFTADTAKMCCLAQSIRNPPFVDGFFIETCGCGNHHLNPTGSW